MKNIFTLIISIFASSILININAQSIYNSVSSGNWNNASTWEITTFTFIFIPPSTFIPTVTTNPATVPPSSIDFVTVKDGHTVSILTDASAATTTINSTVSVSPAQLQISSGINLTTDTLYIYPSANGNSSLTNNGNITTSKIEFNTANAGAIALLTNNGVLNTSITEIIEATGSVNIVLNSGSSFVTTDVNTTNTSAANTVIDLTSGNGFFEISNSFGGSTLTYNGGTAGSTSRFSGTTALTIPASTATFDNLEITNSSGASIDGPLTASNLNGDITVNGGVFNLNGFDIAVPGDINNTGTINANANIDLAGSFISSGTFTSTGANINLEGDWNNTGSYSFQNGDIVTMDGTSSGASILGATNFYELVINKSGQTVSVPSGNQDITSILDLDAGTLNVSSGANVTLLSNASGTAQLDVLESGTTYSGDLIVQRFLSMSNDGWRELTSPVSGTTLANWQDDGIILTGFTGADYDASNWYGWVNSWTYNEPTAAGTKDNGWAEATSNLNTTAFSNGHRIYIGTGNNTLSVKGAPNNGFYLANVTNGGGGSADEQNGWNLIGNPYPCTVDWNTLTHVSVDAAYWIWNATAGNYGIYQTGAGSGTNGVDSHIAHSQAFWVHASAASGFVIFSETSKVRNDKAFVKSNTNDEFVRIKLSGNVNSFSDEALLTFNQNSTAAYDEGIDQNKLFTELVHTAPNLAITTNDNHNLSIAGINEFKSSTIPVKAYAGDSAHGTYTIEVELPQNSLITSCITLEDLETGVITDLKTNPSYTFTTTSNSPEDRFLIHITTPFESTVFEPSCANLTDGGIQVEGSNVQGNTFTLSNNSGAISTITATSNQVSFENLTSGDYVVTSSQVSSCGFNTLNISIVNPQEVIASFELSSPVIYIDNNAMITPNNNSNGENYTWDFGDGNVSFDENPTHTYTSPGIYTISLTVEANGCENTFTETIEVRATTGIEDNDNTTFEILTFENYIQLTSDENITNGIITLTDMNGKLIHSENVNNNNIIINTEKYAVGAYLLNINYDNNTHTEKVIIK